MDETIQAPPGAIPADQFQPAAEPMQADNQQATELPEGAIPAEHFQRDTTEEKYGTPEQMGKTVLEGLGRGVLGPVAPYLEKNLGWSKEEDILGRMKTNPITSTAGEVGGLLIPGSGEGAALEHASQAAGALTEAGRASQAASEVNKALGLVGPEASKTVDLMTQDMPYLSKVGTSALKSATEMAVLEGSNEVTKEVLNDPESSAETAISNIGLGAAMGGAGGALVTGVVSPLWKATLGPKLEGMLSSVNRDIATGVESGKQDPMLRPVIRKAMSSMLGVPPEAIDDYLAHHAAIQTAPEMQDLYEHTMDHVGKVYDDIESSKLSAAEAKTRFNDLEQSLNESFRQRGFDAQQSSNAAKYALRDAQTKLATDLEQKAMDSAAHITGGVESLRNKVIQGSQKAYEVLDSANAIIDLKSMFNKIEEQATALEAEGTQEAKQQAQKLRSYGQGLSEQFTDGKTTGPQAKKLIQGLDKVGKYDFNASSFDKSLSNQFNQLRYHLDDMLKKAVPDYKKAMKPVAKDTSLLAQLKKYGEESGAVRSVRNLKNAANYKSEIPLLQELEKATGSKFLHDIEPYASSELREKLMKSMPEFAEAEKTASDLISLKDPATKARLVEALNAAPEKKALNAAEEALQRAQQAKEGLNGITERNLQQRLKTVATPGKNIQLEEAMKKIPGMQGKTIPELLNLLRIKESFDKNATRGSKHVNLYAGLMGGLSEMLFRHGMPGLAVGALQGAAVDNFGPQMAKNLLDKYMSHFGNIAEHTAENKMGAAKTVMAKILGAQTPANAEGFKAATDFVSQNIKGHEALVKATKNVFRPGAQVYSITTGQRVAERDKLDKKLDEFTHDPSRMTAQGPLSHYMNDHKTAATNAISRQAQYLQSIKPQPHKPGPFDREIKPSEMDLARYHRAQDIANNPNLVLQHVKDGTIQVSDLQDLKSMYPKLYPKMQTMLMKEMTNHSVDEGTIPYTTRMGVSLFLQQPLDATMSPNSIQAAQAQPASQQQQQSQGKTKKGTNSLNKLPGQYKTTSQSAEGDRSGRD